MNNSVLTRRDLLKAALLGAGALALNACSPAAAPAIGPSTTAANAVPPTPVASGQPFKIGLLTAYSKVYAALGKSITDGMDMFFSQVNYTAGGRSLVLLKEDEENDPNISLTKLRKFLDQDKIDLFTGVIATPIVYALRDPLHNAQMPSIISNAGGNDLTRKRKSPYIFRTSFTSWQIAYPLGQFVYDKVAKNVVIAAANYGFGTESAAAFEEGYTKAGGKILDKIFPPLGTNDYGPFLPKIQAAKPEAVYCFFSGTDAVNFVKQFGDYGLAKDIKLTGSGFFVEQDVLPQQGNAALNAHSTLHWALTLDNPENIKFVSDFKAKYNRDADVYAVQGYDTARVIVDALTAVNGDSSSKDNLLAAIRSSKFNSPRGPFVFDQATQNVNQYIYYREVQNVNNALANVVLGRTPDVVVDQAS